MKIRLNEKRAKVVLGIANRLWAEKNTPNTIGNKLFGGIILPQDIYPAPEDPVKHALWLFFAAIFMRGGVISEDPFKSLWYLRQTLPEIFSPENISLCWNNDNIEEFLEEAGTSKYKRKEHAKSWYENALILRQCWGSNPLNIFSGVFDFEEAFARVDYKRNKEKGIIGMRRKIFSLYTIWLQEKNLIPFFPTPIPVDFHAMRLLLATGILEIENPDLFFPKKLEQKNLAGKLVVKVTEKFVDTITLWSQKFIHENGFSHININPFLWVLSRELCAGHFQNASIENGTIYITANELSKNPQLWPINYSDPCQHCPIEKYCSGVIPNKPHYLWGLLMKLERADYPKEKFLLPGIDWAEFQGPVFQKSKKQSPPV